MKSNWFAAVAGISCAAVAVGVAEAVAAATGPGSAPVIAVGGAVVDAAPEAVKEFAITAFGQYDKLALLCGIAIFLAVIAAGLGMAAGRATWIGDLGLAGFGLLGVVCALARPGAGPSWALPSIVGAICAGLALHYIFRETASDQEIGHPVPGRRLDRRGVLAAFGMAGAGGVVGVGLGGRHGIEQARAAVALPPAESMGPRATGLDVEGITPYLTPASDFYRVDTALVVPRVYPDEYRLRIGGRVANPISLGYRDLLDRPMIEREITLSCVSNEVGGVLAGTARWRGIRLAELLAEVKPDSGADQLVGTSADGWTCGTPVETCTDGRDAMLAVGMNGEPLPLERGFPVRMIVPGLYGYVSATKWLVDLKLSSFDDFDPYWVKRDWDAKAPIKTFSRIDTPKPLSTVAAGRVAVAGVAWAQHRGIEAVEVRVDEGDWRPADLAPVISSDTWRQWKWEWDASAGRHSLQVRATDHTGRTQTAKRRPPFPNGATGRHSVVVTVE